MKLTDFIDKLLKSFHPKDWKRITSDFNPDSKELVDHTSHMTNDVWGDYIDLANNQNYKKRAWKKVEDTDGISRKMIHTASTGNVYMTKPYHKRIESGTKNWIKHNVLGWSTMATKDLFDSAGIGNLCEDVKTHEHDGNALTVHKFDPNKESVAKHIKRIDDSEVYTNESHPDVDSIHKIAVMDYLTGNLDRHHGNLMISKEPDMEPNSHYDPGLPVRSVLAIDHERNFQYDKASKSGGISTNLLNGGFTQYGANNAILREYNLKDDSQPVLDHQYNPEELTNWYQSNKDNMIRTIQKHVNLINNPKIRNHILTNFINRINALDNHILVNGKLEFSKSCGSTVLTPKERENPKTNKWMESQLSGHSGINLVNKIHDLNKQVKSEGGKQALMRHWQGAINTLSPDEFVNYFKHIKENKPSIAKDKSLYYEMLSSALGNKELMSAMLNYHKNELSSRGIDTNREDSGFGIPSYWIEKYKRNLRGENN